MIRARALSRTYKTRGGTVEAVKAVDLDVEAGEIVGFLGPNGAGKTTTLRMLATLLEPTSGEATVAGVDLRKEPVEVRRRIGYVSQSGTTLPEARSGEELVDQGMLYGLRKAHVTARGKELFGRLDLEGMWERPTKSMSGGQRRRVDIAMGLIHDPGLLFLDEPTSGLDPQARANLWEHIQRLRSERGTTVFLTTHYLDEADALCDRLMVIDHGEIVATGTPDDLKAQVSGDAVLLTLEDAATAETAVKILGGLDGAVSPAADGVEAGVRVPRGGAALPGLLRELDAAGVALAAAEVRRPTLDDVFLSLTGRSLRDDAPAA